MSVDGCDENLTCALESALPNKIRVGSIDAEKTQHPGAAWVGPGSGGAGGGGGDDSGFANSMKEGGSSSIEFVAQSRGGVGAVTSRDPRAERLLPESMFRCGFGFLGAAPHADGPAGCTPAAEQARASRLRPLPVRVSARRSLDSFADWLAVKRAWAESEERQLLGLSAASIEAVSYRARAPSPPREPRPPHTARGTPPPPSYPPQLISAPPHPPPTHPPTHRSSATPGAPWVSSRCSSPHPGTASTTAPTSSRSSATSSPRPSAATAPTPTRRLGRAPRRSSACSAPSSITSATSSAVRAAFFCAAPGSPRLVAPSATQPSPRRSF